jgi:O-antigen/teichoic acid export membrane protein
MLLSFTLLLQAPVEICMTYIRAQQRPWVFISFSTAKLVLQLSLNIYFVVLKTMHVEGVIYSALLSSAFMSSALLVYTLRDTGLRGSWKKLNEILHFSLPLMLTGLISFYLTFGDRYFIRIFVGLDSVGIYTLGYKFGFIFLLLTSTPFFNIWDSQKYVVLRENNAREIYQRVFLSFSLFLILVALGFAVYAKDVLKFMAAPAFHSAYSVVPLVLAAYLMNAWTRYANLGILIHKKTMEITYGTLIAAAVITPGYLFLIPKYGIEGAALATLFAFTSRCMWVSWRASRLYKMKLPWPRVSAMMLVYFMAAVVVKSTSNEIWKSLLQCTAIMTVCAIFIIALGLSVKQNREAICNVLSHSLKLQSVVLKKKRIIVE